MKIKYTHKIHYSTLPLCIIRNPKEYSYNIKDINCINCLNKIKISNGKTPLNSKGNKLSK